MGGDAICQRCGALLPKNAGVWGCQVCLEREDAERRLEQLKSDWATVVHRIQNMLPRGFRSLATFDDLAREPTIDRPLLEWCTEWRRHQGSLVLLGPTGIGKTACAHAIVQRILGTSLKQADRLTKTDDWRFVE